MDPHLAPDPAIFVIDLQDANEKLILKKSFCMLLFEVTFFIFQRLKVKKKFFLLFLLCSGLVRSTPSCGLITPPSSTTRWEGGRWAAVGPQAPAACATSPRKGEAATGAAITRTTVTGTCRTGTEMPRSFL
jgi:hypothetical protein